MQSTSLNLQRKPGFPVANCSIKMPDSPAYPEPGLQEEEKEQQHRRQQLINFAHSQWGFNNWSWAVTKQELDFVELTNGKYCAGVVAFVSVTVKSFDIHRENIGYATSAANTKGLAIYKSRKCAVTNALRETLLSFGGSVATELLDLSEPVPAPAPAPPDVACENNQNLANKNEPKTVKNLPRKDLDAANIRAQVKNVPAANAPRTCPPPRPAPAPLPRAPLHHPRPNSNQEDEAGPPPPAPEGPDEAARAERRRRQRLAQEEFRLKQQMKNGAG